MHSRRRKLALLEHGWSIVGRNYLGIMALGERTRGLRREKADGFRFP
jgi:hypothetical protein